MNSFNKETLAERLAEAKFAYHVSVVMDGALEASKAKTISFVMGSPGQMVDFLQSKIIDGWRKNPSHDPIAYPNGVGFVLHLDKPFDQQSADLEQILGAVETTYLAECEAKDAELAAAEEASLIARVTAEVEAEERAERMAKIEAAATAQRAVIAARVAESQTAKPNKASK
ncbi:hypothetical protein IFT98_02285 [Pseudomonas sp. CFBP 8770]|uniref:hypothetical protein n=1 Tax=unclassified Pseudomonas TaxID=196821 RepID=UPI0017831C4E|nr:MULTISPECIES: hypothetical protein [unclassified Pseudomonas]MBD8473089.1 hypothetical protein [Pseudomonas sp. CFBP 8773]MBD8645808.1 hypothetical protein [Pseudomonas sp. CFBP 8770]